MSAKGKTAARDLPAMCLLFAVIFALGALALPLAAKLDIAERRDLYSVSGTVQSISRTFAARAGRKLQILITEGNRVHHLTQDDLSCDVPALRSLKTGDSVTALVKHDSPGRDLEWMWELERDGVVIVSYEQTRKFLEGERSRSLSIARWAGALAVALLFAAILLRIRFGGWHDSSLARKAVN